MNTIKDLALKWWTNLLLRSKIEFIRQYIDGISTSYSLKDEEIENIFYNEVILKWFHNDYYNTLVTPEAGYRANLMTADDIISLYLKEHSKEEPKQETTLEEAGVAYTKTVNENHTSHMLGFYNGAKWQQERSYSEEEMISFAEFVATYPDKNRNVYGEILHSKSKYDGAERTIDLLEQFKKK